MRQCNMTKCLHTCRVYAYYMLVGCSLYPEYTRFICYLYATLLLSPVYLRHVKLRVAAVFFVSSYGLHGQAYWAGSTLHHCLRSLLLECVRSCLLLQPVWTSAERSLAFRPRDSLTLHRARGSPMGPEPTVAPWQ
jgi:hypothetical protein